VLRARDRLIAQKYASTWIDAGQTQHPSDSRKLTVVALAYIDRAGSAGAKRTADRGPRSVERKRKVSMEGPHTLYIGMTLVD
jgi:hypothetical protein